MGLLNFLKKDKKGYKLSVKKNEERSDLIVITPSGKTYHSSCNYLGSNTVEYAEVPEFAAVQAGFVRCKRCDWYWFDRRNGNG